MEILQGDIWYANLSRVVKNGEFTRRQLGIRPCIISSNNMYNKYAPTIQTIPLSTQITKESPVHFYVDVDCGVQHLSIALTEQETTIDKSDLLNKIGECTEDVMKNFRKAICIQKGIDEPFDILRAKRMIMGILETKNNIDESNRFAESALVYEFKWYCNRYGMDYKEIFHKYKSKIPQRNEVSVNINTKVSIYA